MYGRRAGEFDLTDPLAMAQLSEFSIVLRCSSQRFFLSSIFASMRLLSLVRVELRDLRCTASSFRDNKVRLDLSSASVNTAESTPSLRRTRPYAVKLERNSACCLSSESETLIVGESATRWRTVRVKDAFAEIRTRLGWFCKLVLKMTKILRLKTRSLTHAMASELRTMTRHAGVVSVSSSL